jgi:hypothetical protein
MTTATIISELLPFHDDALLADIEHIFDEIDRNVENSPPGEAFVIMLLVDELVEDMLTPVVPDELTITLTLDLGFETAATDVYADHDEFAEVAEVA